MVPESPAGGGRGFPFLAAWLALSLAACAPPPAGIVRQGDGIFVLSPEGLYAESGGTWKKLGERDGLAAGARPAAIHLTGTGAGEIWVTYDAAAAAGATRLVPPPPVTLGRSDGLPEPRVAVAAESSGTVFLAPAPALKAGVFARFGTGWTGFNRAHGTLRTDAIARMETDAAGGVWLIPSARGEGVGRWGAGALSWFDAANSALPSGRIEQVVPEGPGEGLPGNRVWLVTSDGLTSFDCGTAGWNHLGRRVGEASDAMRVLGLDGLFTRAVTGITAVVPAPGFLWVVTPRTLYRYDGSSFAPSAIPATEGLSKLRARGAASSGGVLWLALEDLDSRRVSGFASLAPGGTWGVFSLRGTGLPAPREVGFSRGSPPVCAFSPEWNGACVELVPGSCRVLRPPRER